MEESLELAPPDERPRRRRPHRQWRDGGRSTAPWNAELLGWAVLALGVGVLGANAAALLLPPGIAGLASQLVIWVIFAAAVVFALRRSRPRGLLRFRALDVLYAVVFGVALRFAQGAIEGAGGAPAAWPSLLTVDGSLPDGFFVEAFAGTVVAPTLEEFFFRGVILVAAYSVFRRLSGHVAGGIAAAAVSVGLFVVSHLLLSAVDAAGVISLALLAAVASALVLGTGRLWGAVLTHIVFNATGFALLAVGTVLS